MADKSKKRSKTVTAAPTAEVGDRSPARKRRRITIWESLAGRVGKNGWLPAEPIYSKNRDAASSSAIPVPPEELLFRQKHTRNRAANEVRDDTVELPLSDLSSALHRYVSKFYDNPGIEKPHLHFKSMDFSALIAMSILIDEAIQETMGETGHLPFVEGEPNNDAPPPTLFWNGKEWVRSVLNLPTKKKTRRRTPKESGESHSATSRTEILQAARRPTKRERRRQSSDESGESSVVVQNDQTFEATPSDTTREGEESSSREDRSEAAGSDAHERPKLYSSRPGLRPKDLENQYSNQRAATQGAWRPSLPSDSELSSHGEHRKILTLPKTARRATSDSESRTRFISSSGSGEEEVPSRHFESKSSADLLNQSRRVAKRSPSTSLPLGSKASEHERSTLSPKSRTLSKSQPESNSSRALHHSQPAAEAAANRSPSPSSSESSKFEVKSVESTTSSDEDDASTSTGGIIHATKPSGVLGLGFNWNH